MYWGRERGRRLNIYIVSLEKITVWFGILYLTSASQTHVSSPCMSAYAV